MITSLSRHDTHEVKIFQTQNNFVHSYALRCVDCQKHIQWLSVKDVARLKSLGIEKDSKKYITGEKLVA